MGTLRVSKRRSPVAALALGSFAAAILAAVPVAAAEPKPKPPATAFQDEPAAHALYTEMIQAMRKAKTLSYTSRYKMEAKGRTFGECIYRVWLKKPNYFRVETERTSLAAMLVLGKTGGTLVGDGHSLWIYWPNGRLQFGPEDKDDQATRNKQYMTKPTPLARHSIGHEVVYLGAGGSMPILDPSTFHGYTDSLQPYVDGVKGLGTEKVGADDCDKIEVSIMKGQRIWQLWLSKRDHLPRKLKQTVHVRDDIIMLEDWSSVTLDADIPDAMFAWKPPEGWKPWREPSPEERLLKPGVPAPDFDLASAGEGRVKLADFRGRVVWLYIWRAG